MIRATNMTMEKTMTGKRDREQGAVLIVVLMVMLALLGMGVMTLWLTSANLQVGGSVNLRTQALYVAEAGLERARAVLNAAAAPSLNTLMAGATAGSDEVPTALDATTGQPNGVGAILREGTTSVMNVAFPPASFARGSGTAAAPVSSTMGTYTVWIRNDLADLRMAAATASSMTADSNQTVVVRSRGVASDGRTTVVLEMTMVPSALVATPVATGGTLTFGDCVAGKNACDDNSSTQYGISFSGS